MTHNIVIAGYYGHRNAGDEAILAGMLADLRAEIPDSSFTVFSGDPDDTRQLHGVEAVAWSDLPAQVEAVKAASLVVVGGGGLFHDYWGVDPASLLTSRQAGIAQYGGPVVLAHLFGKPSMLYGVGVGPLATPEGRSLTRDLASLVDAVTVRDGGSRDLLLELGCDAEKITVTADPAFGAPARALSIEIEVQLAGMERPVLGVALRHWDIGVDPKTWEPAVAEGLDAYLERAVGNVLFVPLQTGTAEMEDDRKVAKRVQDRMRHADRTVALVASANALERFRVLERCDLVLGMRLHALVAAARGGRPFVALAYDPKVTALANALGESSIELAPESSESSALAHLLTSSLLEASSRRGTRAMGSFPERRGADAREARGLIEDGQKEMMGQTALERLLTVRIEEGIQSAILRKQLLQARAESDDLRHGSEILREQRDAVLADRIRVESELEDLRGTLGVRLLGTYWDFLQRMLPDGSPPRVIYARGGSALRAMAGRIGLTATNGHSTRGFSDRVVRAFVGSGQSQPAAGRSAFAESRAELLRFTDKVALAKPARMAVILSTTQMIQSEGQRATNLAREFSKRGAPVVFGAWRWGPRDPIHVDGDTEGILQLPLDQIMRYPDELFSSLTGCERILIFEFPHPDFVELMAAANAQGWITIYDAIDDWESFGRVGQAPWYEESAERSLAANTDFVVGVSQTLAGKLRSNGVMDVLTVPNGVVEGIDIARERRQLRRGAVTLGYWGYVTNAWFDWPLILETAREVPEWVFYICGYGDGLLGRRLPENVVVLGKVPQTALASIAENLDVGLVPFLTGPLSDAADPVKVYEYLAMGLPVVVTGVKPPAGAEDHVLHARDGVEFRRLIRQAAAMRGVRVDERKAYAQARTWGKRLDSLLEAIDRGDQGVGQKRWLFQEAT